MKEYGGYIELEINHGKDYYDNLIKLNCGRACLAYLIESKKITKLYFPFFVCSSIKQVCEKYGVEYECYYIDENFKPKFCNELNGKREYLYVINYYGQLDRQFLMDLKNKYHNIIVDNVCAFFQEPIDGCDTIYSCRKYFGVADGAYLYTDKVIQQEYQVDVSYKRMQFLLGRFEKSAAEFYDGYTENNKLFAEEPIKSMSKLTLNILRGIDYELVKEKRCKNYKYLDNRLKCINELFLKNCVGPYAYPLLIKNGSKLRQQLHKYKIYIPMLWPEVLEYMPQNKLEYRFANDILPLPIDQRYDESDMKYICEVIEELRMVDV